jgi:hypothetical protein
VFSALSVGSVDGAPVKPLGQRGCTLVGVLSVFNIVDKIMRKSQNKSALNRMNGCGAIVVELLIKRRR